MNPDFDDDETLENTPLTVGTLLGEPPRPFVLCGVEIDIEEETSFYEDEYITQAFQAHDEDWNFSVTLSPVNGDELPPFIDFVWELLQDPFAKWSEGLTDAEYQTVIEARTQRLKEKGENLKAQLDADLMVVALELQVVVAEAQKFPRAVSADAPDDLTAALLRAMEA